MDDYKDPPIPPPKPNEPYEYNHNYNISRDPQPYRLSVDHYKIGIMVNKIEVLEDSVKTAQMTLSDLLLEKRDFEHLLEKHSDRMDDLGRGIGELKDLIRSLDTKICDHVRIDTPITDFVTTKVGKWIIALFGLAGAAIAVEIINNYIKPIFIRK